MARKSQPAAAKVAGGMTIDTLQNLMMGLATEKDKLFGTSYIHVEITRDQLNAAYRGDWIARKTVDIPPFDATREWRSWQATKEQITKIEFVENSLNIRRNVKLALQMARLYGGAALVMGIGKNDQPMDPLNPESVKQGDLRYVHAINRYDLTAGPLIRDPESPWYNEPQYYSRSSAALGEVRIHPSRVVRFIGLPTLDEQMATTQVGWGDSVLQVTNDAIRGAGLVVNAVAQMISEGKMDVISIPGLSAQLSDSEYTGRLTNRFSTTNMMKSIYSMLLIDKDETWQRISTQFSGMPDLLKMYLLIASGAADIPATRMLSQSPAGLSATGESDIRNHYDRIRVMQTTEIQPELARLDAVLLRSALGNVPDDIFYLWNPLWQMDEKERSAISYQKAQTAKMDTDMGLIDRNVMKVARENQIIEDGTYPGFEQALDELDGTEELENEGEDDEITIIDPDADNDNEGDPDADAAGDDDQEAEPPRRRATGDFNPYHESAGTPIGGRFAQTPPGAAPDFDSPTSDPVEYQEFVEATLDGRSISATEREMLAYYSDSGYANINQDLRAGKARTSRGRGTNDAIDAIDEVLYESALPKSIVTYRTASPRTVEMLNEHHNGDLLWDEGYTSTSSSRESVERFIKTDRGGNAAVIAVHLPKGSKALPIGHLSTRPGENEIIVARRSIYSVHTDQAGNKYLRLEKTL